MRLEIHPFKTPEEAREWGRNEIDASSGKARARYLTVSPGQEATYTAKYADAKAYLLAGENPNPAEFPWVNLEAQSTNKTPQEAAERIKELGDFWHMNIGPRIEAVRISSKDSLDNIPAISNIVLAVRQAQKQLDQI